MILPLRRISTLNLINSSTPIHPSKEEELHINTATLLRYLSLKAIPKNRFQICGTEQLH